MWKRVALALAALAIVALIVGARWRRVHGRGGVSVPATAAPGVDYAMSPFAAAFDAPEGATPCETAYNAFHAIDDASRARNKSTPWSSLPERDTFLARCAALPPQEQQCYQPRYSAANHPICDPIIRKYEKNNPLWN
jgi:hypothetical protein